MSAALRGGDEEATMVQQRVIICRGNICSEISNKLSHSCFSLVLKYSKNNTELRSCAVIEQFRVSSHWFCTLINKLDLKKSPRDRTLVRIDLSCSKRIKNCDWLKPPGCKIYFNLHIINDIANPKNIVGGDVALCLLYLGF